MEHDDIGAIGVCKITLNTLFVVQSENNIKFYAGEEMNVFALLISSSNIYYLLIEHDTTGISYYCKVDMSSGSVLY